MDLHDRRILILGGAGLVGQAVARRMMQHKPRTLVLASLRRAETEEAVRDLSEEARTHGVDLETAWGDLFVPHPVRERTRGEILADPDARRLVIDDLFAELTPDVFERSALGRLLLDVEPSIVVDCINTAGAFAYQNAFSSAAVLRRKAAAGEVDSEAVERHLATLYLPQLIRHVQVALQGMKRVGTEIYVKVGTSGTGGMGLNIPFTHSEERPSRVLLAKAGLAGAHTLLLYLMARTPGAPAVKEVKPTAAISWKSLAYGPIHRGGRTFTRSDAIEAVPVERAFENGAERAYRELGEPLEGVYVDSGENGLFSLPEFETLTALGLMEFVTPEEIADAVVREIQGHPTGLDVVSALDAASMGPTYRAGVLRSVAIQRMEELERKHRVQSVAYEMLGPPRLTKLLFESAILQRLYDTLEAGARLDPEDAARRSEALIREDDDFRQRILSVGLPILLPDGASVLRGPLVDVPPPPGTPVLQSGVVESGWIDLRASNWTWWKHRIEEMRRELASRPGLELGSRADYEFGDQDGRLRPGRMAAWIFRHVDQGERGKR